MTGQEDTAGSRFLLQKITSAAKNSHDLVPNGCLCSKTEIRLHGAAISLVWRTSPFFKLAYPTTKCSPSRKAQARNLSVSHWESSHWLVLPFPCCQVQHLGKATRELCFWQSTRSHSHPVQVIADCHSGPLSAVQHQLHLLRMLCSVWAQIWI